MYQLIAWLYRALAVDRISMIKALMDKYREFGWSFTFCSRIYHADIAELGIVGRLRYKRKWLSQEKEPVVAVYIVTLLLRLCIKVQDEWLKSLFWKERFSHIWPEGIREAYQSFHETDKPYVRRIFSELEESQAESMAGSK